MRAARLKGYWRLRPRASDSEHIAGRSRGGASPSPRAFLTPLIIPGTDVMQNVQLFFNTRMNSAAVCGSRAPRREMM